MTTITILDSNDVPNPESRAVLQALASRSTASIQDQKDKVNADKTQNFIDINCIGYGHDSVLENADGIIISLYGISMLAAKAFEDASLFKGTEASTRYIDITGLPFHIGEDYPGVGLFRKNLIQRQFDFFNTNYPVVKHYMSERFPYEFLSSNSQAYSESVYDKAIGAKAFDVMRAFLPPGASTIVNWTTNLRTLKERLTELMGHHLLEVRSLAINIAVEAKKRYPTSFKNFPNSVVVDHIRKFGLEYHSFPENADYGPLDNWRDPQLNYQKFDIGYAEDEIEIIKANYPSLQERPRGAPLPRIYATNFAISGLMDFGSFRDIQRHRNGLCKMDILTDNFGFEQWYMDQLPPALVADAQAHLDSIKNDIKDFDPINKQYFIPFGYRMPYVLDYSLEQTVYVAELRSSKHVHPTCRVAAQGMDRFLTEKFPFIKLYTDRSESDFDIRRGTHDIAA